MFLFWGLTLDGSNISEEQKQCLTKGCDVKMKYFKMKCQTKAQR